MSVNRQSEETGSFGLAQYGALAVRSRWWIILSACTVWALVLAAALVLPAKYKSETVIIIEQPKVSAQYVTPSVSVDLQDRLQSLTEQVESRTRLLRIIDDFHLYGKQPNQVASDALVQRMRTDISIDLVKSPGRSGEISAFKISYSAPSAIIAQEVVGQLTSQFIQEDSRTQQDLAQRTTEFLDSELADARKDLEEQEKLLGQFRSQNLGELPEQLGSNVQILAGLQGRLQSATDALHQAEQQKLYLTSLLGQSKASQAPGTESEPENPSVTPTLDQQLERMRADLADKMTRYTPQHPDIVRLKEQIATAEKLKRQTEDDIKSGKHSPDLPGVRQSPVISPTAQLEGQLKANELEITHRKDEIKSLEGEIAQYEGRLNLTPVREQQLAAIERNHRQSQTNYESLLAKKEQSEMATNLEKRQQGLQFRMIDPPSLPEKPYWPNRLQFSLGGLLGGAFLGFAICVLAELIAPRVHSEQELVGMGSFPVLITVPRLATLQERQDAARKRRFEIAAAAVIAVCVPVLTMLAQIKG